jgi:hypothetical protein
MTRVCQAKSRRSNAATPTAISTTARTTRSTNASQAIDAAGSAGAYSLQEVWWNNLIRFTPPTRWTKQMRRDQMIVAIYALGTLIVLVSLDGTSGIWHPYPTSYPT